MTIPMPEPVAWSILDKRTGKHWYTHESKYTAQMYASHYSHREGDGAPSMTAQPLITTTQAEAYAAAKVREALEDAAQACEARIGQHAPGMTPEDVEDCAEEAGCAPPPSAP